MTPTEIISNDPETQKVGAAKVLAGIGKLVKDGRAIVLQYQNSVLLVISIGEGQAELHLYSVAQPQEVAGAIKYFHNRLSESDIHQVYGSAAQNSPIFRFMTAMGLPIQKSDKPNYTWMAKV